MEVTVVLEIIEHKIMRLVNFNGTYENILWLILRSNSRLYIQASNELLSNCII